MSKVVLPKEEMNLLQLLKQDDMSAFEKLYKQYHKVLWHFARELLKDEDEAEDTVQQVFIRIWEKRNDLLISTSFKSYLFTSVRHACLKKIEKSQREYVAEIDEDAAPVSVTEAAQYKDLQQAISAAIESLPERCRLIFRLSRFAGMSYNEIASELNLSVKTVENQMSKALNLMRQSLRYHICWIGFALLQFLWP